MALRAMQIWKANAENTCGSKLMILQTDNEAEFMGKKFIKRCQEEGITHYTTASYGPI